MAKFRVKVGYTFKDEVGRLFGEGASIETSLDHAKNQAWKLETVVVEKKEKVEKRNIDEKKVTNRSMKSDKTKKR